MSSLTPEGNLSIAKEAVVAEVRSKRHSLPLHITAYAATFTPLLVHLALPLSNTKATPSSWDLGNLKVQSLPFHLNVAF